MAHNYNPNSEEAEEGGSRVQGQLGLQSEILCQEIRKEHIN